MKINILKESCITVRNINTAIDELAKEYGISKDEFHKELHEHSIIVTFLGRKISINYINEEVIAKKNEDNSHTTIPRVYKEVKCKSFEVNEIKNIIIHSFNRDYMMEGEGF